MRASAATLKFTLFLHYFVLSLLFTSTFTDSLSIALHAMYEFGLSSEEAESLGMLKVVSFVCAVIFGIGPAGRIGYLRLSGMSLLPLILISLILPFFGNFFLIQLLYVFTGLAWGLSLPAAYAVLSELSADRRDFASLINRFETFILPGFGIGFLMSAWVISLDDVPWRQMFLGWAILAGLTAWLFYRHRDFRTEKRNPEPAVIRSELFGSVQEFFRLFTHTLIILFILALCLLFFSEQQMINWAKGYTFDLLRISREEMPQVIGLVLFSAFLSRLFASFVVKLFDPFHFLTLWLGISLAAMIVIGETVEETTFRSETHHLSIESVQFFYIPLLAFFWAPVMPTLSALVLWHVPEPKRALIAGFILCVSVPVAGLGELLSETLFANFSFSIAFFFTLLSVGLLLVVITLLISDIRKQSNTKKAPEKETGAGIFSFMKR